LNPCIAHCSTDSIPWVHHSREEKSLDYDRGFVRLQIHMNFDTIIYRQQDSTFQQGSTPRRSPLPPPPPTMNSPGRWGGGRTPAAHAAGTPHSLALGVPATGSSSPSCALPALVHTAVQHGRPPAPGVSVDPIMRRPQSPSAKRQLSRSHWCVTRERGEDGGLLTAGASCSITNDQRSSLSCRMA
jgi:hypothetical protein